MTAFAIEHHLNPAASRRDLVVPPGATIADIVGIAFPDWRGDPREELRATVGDVLIEPRLWHLTRPKPGAVVIVRPVPGDRNALRTSLQVAVLVAALVASQTLGGPVGTALFASTALASYSTALGTALVSAGVATVGTLAINALVPVRPPQGPREGSATYSLQGLRNVANPGGPIPDALGFNRWAPPYACLPISFYEDNESFVIAVVDPGIGPYEIDDIRIGETPITEFEDVEIETRQGFAGDAALTLYTNPIVEEGLAITVVNSAGRIVRRTHGSAVAIQCDLVFDEGLTGFDGDGDAESVTVVIRFEYRRVGDVDWTLLNNVPFTGSTTQIYRFTFGFPLPSEDIYDIGLTRITADPPEDTANHERSKANWTVLRSFKTGFAFVEEWPTAKIAIKLRATEQHSGILDTLNCITRKMCRDWDSYTGSWIFRATNNPASLARFVLQNPANAEPADDSEIDLDDFAEWHEFCADNQLTYNRVHDYVSTQEDVLADICAAGRATLHDRGDKISIVIDRPQTVVAGHISARNSWGISGEFAYRVLPDAFRVTFKDEDDDFRDAELVVARPDLIGEVVVLEELSMPGVTNRTVVYREARRRFFEMRYRPDLITVNQDWEADHYRRGDLVLLAHDTIDSTQVGARVKSISGALCELDEAVTIEAATGYAAYFRLADGSSVLHPIQATVGQASVMTLLGAGPSPAAGDLALVGVHTRAAGEYRIKDIERTQNLTSRLTLVAHAPEIDVQVAVDPRLAPVVLEEFEYFLFETDAVFQLEDDTGMLLEAA